MRWHLVDYYGTRLKMRQDLYFRRGFIHPWGDNSSSATVLDSSWDKIRRLFSMRIYSSMRWHPIDYYSSDEETCSLSPRRVIHPWNDDLATTTVLGPSRDKISTSQEDSFIHEITTYRPPWKSYSSTRRKKLRLLRYSANDRTRSLLIHETTNKSTTTVLEDATQGSQRQASSKATTRSVVNSKEKSTIHPNVKSTAVDSHPHKS